MARESMSNSHGEERKRSRSPSSFHEDRRGVKRHRSRSPRTHKHHRKDPPSTAKLPFHAQHLQKHDFEPYKALFVDYLDLQKQLEIDSLDEHEVKGRWKSFLKKWNQGELAAGWYDPETKKKADERTEEDRPGLQLTRSVGELKNERLPSNGPLQDNEDQDGDDYGPTLPNTEVMRRSGPVVPSLEDLQHRGELAEEDRGARLASIRHERKQDRQLQKQRLEELAPRADPASRERQLEKKRETTLSNKTRAEAKESGTDEVGEGDLMGDDGVDGYKAKRRAVEKKKNEREIRKEEVLRARAAEREEKMSEHRRKEEKTMDMLRAIAQQRFGDGS